ncbi:tRNA (adenosine(37)-N6)-threonylcarbamoyltransferase complex dimerization subunit type 1 TsaB [Simplicispira suum]|uniref:tRNA (Adenosine(37)-N6)-threonylcarbamoyltransferase complex dimerization subunit type 1 TsaB n=1 Tax=Simplicispira suum TaxID=2109915 RepID=A0A2S0MZS5_9BURK|nr:tRNA (adenosine(37)-N6)-threonylcarbamoyltransferase complex dimerization subunit type 1 TsaB [Simplicispira suum]AVO41398.1 tRNA (adenosine(37)-N6)-threonylcarbamoyltransferase complex dimerization subunit type 1 TsaB [Simplicispira suum]
MKLLAFDTSTESLSIAVQHGERVITHSGTGGAQASAGLIPALRQALGEAALSLDALDALVFGRGPGSFTGVRTACSVAQGLAFGARGGAGLPVLPIGSLLAVAEDARHRHGCTQVVAVLDARMDEVYMAHYSYDAGHWSTSGDCSVCAPESMAVQDGWTVAGNAHAVYGARLAPHALHVQARPEAAALLRLAPALLAQGLALAADAALPLYVRNKVAQTTAERAAMAAQRGATAP